jgi:predicted RNase H-like HicB family nuclease
MRRGDRYLKIVEWSEEDGCFVGSCPELFYGGCHGSDAKAVFAELCDIIEETVSIYEQDGKLLPTAMSGRDFVNSIQKIA